MSIELEFCDICNESVPAPDLIEGRAHRRGGRLVCATCERSMGVQVSTSSLPPEASAGTTAVETPTESPVNTAAPDVTPVTPARSGGAGWLALIALVMAVALGVSLSSRLELLEGESGKGLKAVQRDLQTGSQDQRIALARLDKVLNTQLEGLVAQLQTQRELDQAALLQMTEQISVLRERAAGIAATLDGFRAQFIQLSAEQNAQQAREGTALAALGERMRAQEDQLIAVEGTLRALSLAPIPVVGGGSGGSSAPVWAEVLGDLSSDNPGLRLDAVYSLGSSQDTTVIPHLIPMVQDSDVFVRMAACRTLSDLDARIAVPDLIEALNDPATVVREAAVVALRRITKRGMRFDPLGSPADRTQRVAKWLQWWQKEGQAFLGES